MLDYKVFNNTLIDKYLLTRMVFISNVTKPLFLPDEAKPFPSLLSL